MTSGTSIWSSPPASLSLHTNEVHVWRLTLDHPVENFIDLLQPDEIKRANRFHFEKDRRHFVVARGFLRVLLGRYLQIDPEHLQFSYGAWGKPALDGELRESQLRFNMSHSHGMALYAIAERREIGVDVEHVRADFASENVARRFFSPFEVGVLCELPAHDRVAGFFRCWTRKEAYIKATGRGMSQPLDGFDVTLGSEEAVALLRNDDGSHERWKLVDIAVAPGYAGALAVEKPVSEIRYLDADDRN
ncbi:MAG TPA: 4'-phosphopantetheinyl transferase superfamily protein [Pyrinomonadaceae bacterium]|nr:4'-phosphopantetheinyl transferase superfamily protein [Pyrinomonadaceae bacterium]